MGNSVAAEAVSFQRSLQGNSANKATTVPFPRPDAKPSVIAIAFHKAGSVMLDAILEDLCAQHRRSHLRLDSILFDQGFHVQDFDEAISKVWEPSGYVYGVFRSYLDAFVSPTAQSCRKIFLIRDPRDVFVSYFYSMKYSHTIPETGEVKQDLQDVRSRVGELTIDDALVQEQFHYLFVNMKKISRLLDQPNSRIYRYEDVVFAKRAWVQSLAGDLGIQLDPAVLDSILEKVDIIPDAERPAQHIRQVRPGNFANKLLPSSIKWFGEHYGDLLAKLGY